VSLLLRPGSLAAICLFAWAIAFAGMATFGAVIFLFPSAATLLLVVRLFDKRKPGRVLTPYQRWLRNAKVRR
jgi:hypothetical protein